MTLKVAIQMDHVSTIDIDGDSTFVLGMEAQKRGYEVWHYTPPELIFRVYRDEFDRAYQEGTMLMLTMHPHVIGHRSRIVHLENLIAYMKTRPDVWFATAAQIASAVKGAGEGSTR